MSAPITDAALLDALRWRCAVKKFDPQAKIPPAQWEALEESLRLSPSAFGLQAWSFIVINDPALRAAVREQAAYNRPCVTEASHLVALAYRHDVGAREIDAHLEVAARIRNLTPEAVANSRAGMLRLVTSIFDKSQVNAWASRQVYIAMGVLLASAALLRIDACPLEGIDPPALDRVLGLPPDNLKTLAMVALGYRAADDTYSAQPKVRFPREAVFRYL